MNDGWKYDYKAIKNERKIKDREPYAISQGPLSSQQCFRRGLNIDAVSLHKIEHKKKQCTT